MVKCAVVRPANYGDLTNQNRWVDGKYQEPKRECNHNGVFKQPKGLVYGRKKMWTHMSGPKKCKFSLDPIPANESG